MMKRYACYVLLLVVTFLAASCSSSRHAAKMPMVGGLSGTAYIEKVIDAAPDWNSLSGKTSLELGLGSKGSTRVNATMKIQRGEVIQFSVAPVLGIEVARLELTPQGLLLVDRMNKRFVRASFREVSELLHIDVNFNMLQSLFLNELFVPGKAALGPEDVSAFMLTADADEAVMQVKGGRRINYKFLTSSRNGLLEHTVIGLKGTPYALNWDYSNFSELDGCMFPRRTEINLRGIKEPYFLHLRHSRLSTDGKWKGQTRLSSRYKEISLSELLTVLLNLKL